MKKSYFLMATAAALFAACAETDFVNEATVQDAPKAIGFETFSNKATRHSILSTMNTYHLSFGVYGYNDVDGLFMENYKVAYADSKWGYNGVEGGTDGTTVQEMKYWNKKTSYDFYAYAPYDEDVTITAGKFTIPEGNYAAEQNLQQTFSTGLNNGVFTADVDWMLAAPKNDYAHSNGATVPLSFSHMLSKLIVEVKTTGDEDVEIQALSITGNTYKTGSYDGEDWTATNEEVLEGSVGTVTLKNTPYYSMEYLLIPVTTAAPKLTIKYRVNGQTYTETDLDITGITSFAEGTYYTLTITVGLEPIAFNATANVWTEGTPGGSVSIE